MSQIKFVDTRVAVTDRGTVSFVEADGDFTTADGRPYRNVYVMRFEWTPDGRILRADEYYNPIIACQTFENPACDRSATAR
jgi:ketosteroid isomerase-like protein